MQSALAVVCIMDSTPNACAEAVRQERSRERERQQRAEETAEDREQRLVIVCAAILDCSHLLLIVAIGIALAMQGSPHNAMHPSSSLGIDDGSFKCLNIGSVASSKEEV